VIAVIQRVASAQVSVAGEVVGAIGPGLLALVGVAAGDTASDADRLLERMLAYRIFPDPEGRMNLSLAATGGGLLLVSQFTLAADTRKGLRPGFQTAAAPQDAERLYDHLVAQARQRHPQVGTGRFGADMQVALVNDGPVTFILHSPPLSRNFPGHGPA
jgi:D-aminoacyl-tRNA deacylase